ncbi:hypothetical protein H0H93_005755 [Arthromyces matolae]|nr:hypothetical protein H0H93_005755 [Arthromyces matolae]
MSSSTNANVNANIDPISTSLSPISSAATISPTWAPPKSPLPPHRLAKLANALGVSTPMPATHQTTSFMSRSYLDFPSSEALRRSPTPSTSASNLTPYSSTTSRYILHVIPPTHLPHDTNDTDLTPPPATASGYHIHFQRGILVPFHSNLQSQLAAIAKEYALPSTVGMILYLVSSGNTSQSNSDDVTEETDGPGPRLSEDIWKHLWTRVWKMEQREDAFIPSPLRSPLGMSLGTQSTPYLPHESNGQTLRPFLSASSEVASPSSPSNHVPPSPSTPSTISDLRSNTRSTPPSDASVHDSETPETSLGAPSFVKDPETRANSLDLPGLMSSSIIPILAKVEFDVDRRKAAWYEPWLRSRRMNHAKRTESRNGRQTSQGDSGENSDGSQEHHRHIGLLTGNKDAQSKISLVPSSPEEVLTAEPVLIPDPPLSEGYQQLEEEDEDPEQSGWSEDSEEEAFTERVATMTLENHRDALADIFGTDAETWENIKASSPRRSMRQANPNIVDLALNAADLTALPSPTQSEEDHFGREEDEVQALLDQMSRLSNSGNSGSAPSSPTARSSISSARSHKKHVPPPLTLVVPLPVESIIHADSKPAVSAVSGLAYLRDDGSSGEDEANEVEYGRVKSPSDSIVSKREGAVFDDLDLGLDPTEDYDDSDPNDRRRSQFLMMAQLDEIERTMAQLSPRNLQTGLAEEQTKYTPMSPSNSMSLSPGKLNADYFPPSPRLPQHKEIPDSPLSPTQAAWPATPFVSIKNVSPPRPADRPPSPPRLAVNGVTTSAPKSFTPNISGEISEESALRKRELEQEQGYQQRRASPPKPPYTGPESPLLPLSPDPFGRFASTPAHSVGSQPSSVYWDRDAVPDISNESAVDIPVPIDNPARKRSNSTATSRFSTDSITVVEPILKSNRATLMSVNTIKKLWRKSTKNVPPSPSPTVSNGSIPAVPPVPLRPSLERAEETPQTPTQGRFSPQLSVPRQSQGTPPPLPQTPGHLSVPAMLSQHSPIPHSQSPPPYSSQPPSQTLSPVPHPQNLPMQASRPQVPPHPHNSVPYPTHPQPVMPPQLSVPPPLFNGNSTSIQPIMATKMRPGRSNSTLDHFQFDQESPYPITPRRPVTKLSPTPTTVLSPQVQTMQLPPTTPSPNGNLSHMAPPQASTEKSARKSILKGRKPSLASSITSMQPQAGSIPEPHSGIERQDSNGSRFRRPGILNTGSSRTSVTSPPPDIPPSPRIPQQFLTRNDTRQSVRSRLTNSSIDSSHSSQKLNASSTSPRRSMASSRSSQESHPSFDTSQFEIVSPKAGATFSYPHQFDHSLDTSAEGN